MGCLLLSALGGRAQRCGAEEYEALRPVRRTKAISDLAALSRRRRSRSRSAREGAGRRDARPALRRKPRRSLVLPIVIGISFAVAAVSLAGFLVTLTSRPAPPPKTAVAALPALDASPPPLTAAPSNSLDQTTEPEERLERLEPPPIQIGVAPQDNIEVAPLRIRARLSNCSRRLRGAAPPVVLAPLPPSRPLELAPPANAPTAYDQLTAIYDISAHTVYLPDGMRLEAHSGLGDRIDDPRFVDERDHGATPLASINSRCAN